MSKKPSNTNINIRIPDLISNTTTTVATNKPDNRLTFNNDSDSDDLTFTRPDMKNTGNNGAGTSKFGLNGNQRSDHHAIQMQHQVSEAFKLEF